MSTEVISYAQNREDLILAGFFADDEVGFYVDVGANEAVLDSVTKLFYDRGWHGINIEPLPRHYKELVVVRPRDINLNIGVGAKQDELVLREYVAGTGLSTFSETMKQQYKSGDNAAAIEYVDHTVKIKLLADVFKEQKVEHISFMKVDVEGFEYEVLVGNDWIKYRPEVLCIEANHVEKDWHPLLKKHNYTLAFFDGLNEYFVAKERPERLQRFSYIDAIIFKGAIVNPAVASKLAERDELLQKITEYDTELQLKSQYITNLEGLIQEITPLRRHFKRQLKLRLRSIDAQFMDRLDGSKRYTPNQVTLADQDYLHTARTVDQANFAAYNRASRQPLLLKVYKASRKLAIGAVSRLLRLRKV